MRDALLFLGCMVLWGAGWASAVSVANTLNLAGGAGLAVRAAGPLVGFASAGLLMVAMRWFIAPTRADGRTRSFQGHLVLPGAAGRDRTGGRTRVPEYHGGICPGGTG